MLKIIGSILIILSATGFGYEKSLQYKKKYEYQKELKKICAQLKADIAYGKTPLVESFEEIAKRSYDPFQVELLWLSRTLREKRGGNFYEIWKEFAGKLSEKIMLSKEGEKDFIKLGAGLGKMDVEYNLTTIESYLEELQYEMEEQRKKLPGRVKISCCLGIITGIFTAILFT